MDITISQADIRTATQAASSGGTHQYAFCDFLRERLRSDGPVPLLSYLLTESLVITDLKRGIDGITNEATPYDITGLPPMTYNLMAQLVRGYLPDEFLAAIATIEKEMYQEQAG